MKKLIKRIPPKAITALLVVAALLLLSGSVGGTRAALTYYSDTYSSRIELENIGVTLEERNAGSENGEWGAVAWRNYDEDGKWEETKIPVQQDGEEDTSSKPKLFTGMLGDDTSIKIGKTYTEELRVKNTGDIGEYVRVTIYKYWVDKKEGKPAEKDLTMDPDLIKLELNLGESGWVQDTSADSPERTVLYYTQVLPNTGENYTKPFTNSLTIDNSIVKKVTEEKTEDNGVTFIKTTYDYDGKQFRVEVEVDAVQDHNAEEAILSAWGRNVTVENGKLSLR